MRDMLGRRPAAPFSVRRIGTATLSWATDSILIPIVQILITTLIITIIVTIIIRRNIV